jgi:ABC-type polar amino acid transport system ATPase subunit
VQTSATIEARDLTKTYKDVRALDGLGFAVEADMWAEIAHLSGAEGLTILLTTHYLEEADRLAIEGRSLRARTGNGSAAVPSGRCSRPRPTSPGSCPTPTSTT